MNDQPMTKSTLLTILQENHALFQRSLAKVSKAQMTQPLALGQWAGKDILAHLTAWNHRLIGWLRAAARNETPEIPEPGATWSDVDRLNTSTFAETHQLPLADVCEAFEHSFQQVLAQVQVLSDEQLTDPQRYDWLQGQPLWRRITRGLVTGIIRLTLPTCCSAQTSMPGITPNQTRSRSMLAPITTPTWGPSPSGLRTGNYASIARGTPQGRRSACRWSSIALPIMKAGCLRSRRRKMALSQRWSAGVTC